MKPLLGAALLAAVVLAGSACGSGQPTGHGPAASPLPTSGGQARETTVSSSGLMLDGAVRCTATLTTPVQAGDELDVTFRFHNVSRHTAKVSLAYGGMWVLVKSPDGTMYDSRIPLESQTGPFVPPTPVQPGATLTRRLQHLRVRWEGPLRITPGCGLSALRPVRVEVTSPGLPASQAAAVSDVVAATGHLLDHCRPHSSGVSVVGRIDPPSGNAPPLQARCSIELRRERGFYVAQVLIVTPPDLHGVRIQEPYEGLSGTSAASRNTEAIAWQLVVTGDGATTVNATETDTTRPGGGMSTGWDWTGTKWQTGDRSLCGGSDGSFGTPTVVFVSVCGR